MADLDTPLPPGGDVELAFGCGRRDVDGQRRGFIGWRSSELRQQVAVVTPALTPWARCTALSFLAPARSCRSDRMRLWQTRHPGARAHDAAAPDDATTLRPAPSSGMTLETTLACQTGPVRPRSRPPAPAVSSVPRTTPLQSVGPGLRGLSAYPKSQSGAASDHAVDEVGVVEVFELPGADRRPTRRPAPTFVVVW